MARNRHLTEKDRKLIAAHQTGKALLKAFPGLKKLVDLVDAEENVKNVAVGSIVHTGLTALKRTILGKGQA